MASGGDGAPKAVAFALKGTAKARPTVPVNGGGGEAARDFVTAMGDGALASAEPRARQAGPLVIPALANTFETGVGKRPRGVRSLTHRAAAPRSRVARRSPPGCGCAAAFAAAASRSCGGVPRVGGCRPRGASGADAAPARPPLQVPSFIPEASADLRGEDRFEKAATWNLLQATASLSLSQSC